MTFILLFSILTSHAQLPLYYDDLDKTLKVELKTLDGSISREFFKVTKPKYQLGITAVVFRGTAWSDEYVKREIRTTAKVLSQCQIELSRVELYSSDAYNDILVFDQKSRIDLLKQMVLRIKRRPLALFVTTNSDYPENGLTISSDRNIEQEDHQLQNLLLEQSREIARHYLMTEDVLKKALQTREAEMFYPLIKPTFNVSWIHEMAIYRTCTRTLAHELVHTLTQAKHVEQYGNLMSSEGYAQELGMDLTTEQCQAIINSPYVRPYR